MEPSMRIVPLSFLAACVGASDAPAEACTECLVTDANNFAYTAELTIDSLVIPEQANVTARWDGLTRDMRGDALDPAALREARLIVFRELAPEEIAYAVSHDELDQSDVSVYVTCTPHEARCALSEFGLLGNALDIQEYLVEGYGTWLLALGKEPGALGADALAFLAPRADGTATEVEVTDSTSYLDAEVDLRSLTPIVVPPFQASLTLDWSGLAHDGADEPLDLDTVDELWVGRFAEGLDELEQDVFALESLADTSWTMDVAGATSADLADLGGERPFTGIGRDGTWAVALRCRSCTNPAPRLLTFLEPEE